MITRILASIALAAMLVSVAGGSDAGPPGGLHAAPVQAQAQLTQVATFEHQVTGVTVAPNGRIFVNFPRWTEDAPVSVAELMPDGSVMPFSNEEWNTWRNALKDELSPENRWVCVQSVVADRQGNLWVIDPAAPAQAFLVPGGPKLVKIDLASNTVAQNIRFDGSVAPQGSYLNDVRFSPDGRHAYITDSGARGAIVVVDLQSGQAWRTLDGHPSTQPEKGLVVMADGQPLRRPDGRGVEFAADGIALSPDGSYLYWQAVKGKTLYRIPTDALEDAALSPEARAARVELVGETNVADGILMDRQGRLYITAPEEDAVKVLEGDGLSIVAQGAQLRWPDTLSEGPDGAIYVTASRIQDMSWYKPENGPRLSTSLFRIEPSR